MTESSPQPNEQPQPRRRNIYDYDGEYEFPTLCSIGPRQAFQHRPRQVIIGQLLSQRSGPPSMIEPSHYLGRLESFCWRRIKLAASCDSAALGKSA